MFGSEDDSAQNAQLAQNNQVLALQQKLGEQARGDALDLFPVADANRNLGFQAALDAFGQGTGQQLGAFQGGNIGAQNTMLAGLPQQNNAILGLPTDLSGLQAQQIQFDPSFLNQQVPDFQTTGQTVAGPNQQAQNLANLIASLQQPQAGGTPSSGGFFNQMNNGGFHGDTGGGSVGGGGGGGANNTGHAGTDIDSPGSPQTFGGHFADNFSLMAALASPTMASLFAGIKGAQDHFNTPQGMGMFGPHGDGGAFSGTAMQNAAQQSDAQHAENEAQHSGGGMGSGVSPSDAPGTPF